MCIADQMHFSGEQNEADELYMVLRVPQSLILFSHHMKLYNFKYNAMMSSTGHLRFESELAKESRISFLSMPRLRLIMVLFMANVLYISHTSEAADNSCFMAVFSFCYALPPGELVSQLIP